MLKRVISKWRSRSRSNFRRQLSTVVRQTCTSTDDEGSWNYSSEWWDDDFKGQAVFQSFSDKGNGLVSVLSYPSSTPNRAYWPEKEKWLQERYAEIHPGSQQDEKFMILGYQWRVLRFNTETRQSTVKIMAACRESDAGSVYLMQQARCLAVPYVKSMLSSGLASIKSCDYDLKSAILGKKTMNILCIGHGGGTLPLFLADKIQGAIVDIVELDPVVISASTKAMAFPSYSIMNPSGERANLTPDPKDEVMWKGIHERLQLYESDAEDFVVNSTKLYDMVFVDAYDGQDIFPHKLWDPQSPFLNALSDRLHPEHGTVVVNLHADTDLFDDDDTLPSQLVLPMGKYVKSVCEAYKNVIVGNSNGGLAFNVLVPWVCNSSLVISRGFRKRSGVLHRDTVLDILVSNLFEVEDILNLPFSCLEYLKRGIYLVN
ncbi:hypothetical protein DCAR_0102385 [Daucus carota subsp. sativus]|uniref:Uncharacterized protein n=1 Tax=Daucus carota subsp. sativus TaxID=79200 RepID=A0AAF0W571_DAUCS|nr:PREDICTED: uncharacterized protein LOC108210112 isoform X1 [Daucus carota subsp. sativus]WOG83211.1 hypothetical protein DCAR_0102385 [Daucus carota subsp. sativus]